MTTSTSAFLQAIIPFLRDDWFIEIRTKNRSGRITQVFTRSADEACHVGASLSTSADVWYGVGARVRRSGTKADTGSLGAAWADVDFKVFDNESAAYRALSSFALPPSIVVASGGGLQPYWLLDSPTSDFTAIESINKGLTVALGPPGRPLDNATDAARVLRLPGTMNFKYEPPRVVQIREWHPGLRYDLAQLRAAVPAPPSRTSPSAIEDGSDVIPEGDRNTRLTSLAGSMRRRGMTAEEIGCALLAVNSRRCRPPLNDQEVLRIAESVARYTPIPFPTTLERRAHARAKVMW